MKEHIEIIDGKEYKVTRLPSDTRLQPARTRKRALWNKLTPTQKSAYIAKKKRAAAKKRRRKKSRR